MFANIYFILVNPCITTPCYNGGLCNGTSGVVICICTGYEGTLCETDIDECTAAGIHEHGCLNNGICVNTLGAYECDCSAVDFIGQHCETGENSLFAFLYGYNNAFKTHEPALIDRLHCNVFYITDYHNQ